MSQRANKQQPDDLLAENVDSIDDVQKSAYGKR